MKNYENSAIVETDALSVTGKQLEKHVRTHGARHTATTEGKRWMLTLSRENPSVRKSSNGLEALREQLEFLRGGTGTLTWDQLYGLRRSLLSIEDFPAGVTHPNGFSKITIWTSSDKARSIRVHVWPEGTVGNDANIHGHAWNFTSVILEGTLMQEKYSAHDSLDGNYCLEYYRPGSGLPLMYGTSLFNLQVTSTDALNEKDYYSFKRDEIHQIRKASKGAAVSIVLTWDRMTDVAVPVYRNRTASNDYEYSSDLEIGDKLKKTLS